MFLAIYNYSSIKEHPFPVCIRVQDILTALSVLVKSLVWWLFYKKKYLLICYLSSLWRRVSEQSTLRCDCLWSSWLYVTKLNDSTMPIVYLDLQISYQESLELNMNNYNPKQLGFVVLNNLRSPVLKYEQLLECYFCFQSFNPFLRPLLLLALVSPL